MSNLKGAQNVTPRTLPMPEHADHAKLRVPKGPWNQEVWVLVPHAGDVRSGTTQPCRVHDCGRPPHYVIKSPTIVKAALCYAHYMQWYRDGEPEPITEWSATRARKLSDRPSRVSNPEKGIDFRGLPESLATEIRFAAGTKIARGDWTSNRDTRTFLECLIEAAVHHGARSFLEHDFAGWDLLLREQWSPAAAYNTRCRPYLKTFYSTLTRGLILDPWAEDRWLWKSCFDTILSEFERPGDRGNLRWDLTTTNWLRNGVKHLAKKLLITGERKWCTIEDWTRAVRVLDEYLVQEGIGEPQFLDREVFLDFLGWVRERKGSKHNLMGVNTTATILELLRADGIVPNLGAPVYLRRGENAVKKPRNPRPYPSDIIDQIDQAIIQDPGIDLTVRMMLRFARWSGPRISELITMPLDVLHHNPGGGYWVEYWMTKTDSWRRFPVPDDLAEEIRRQQDAVRDAFGNAAEHLFPSLRSNRSAGRTHQWTASGFRNHVKTLFVKHGISKSALTGELVTGGEIHRYRHTIGTALLNNNWTQPEVQAFLGHISTTMTSYYAKITDETLVRKANEFHRKQDDVAAASRLDPKVERLREKFSVVLPNGGCKLPANMKCDFRPNPCLECSFFEPIGEGVEETNQTHRIRLKTLIADARESGDQAIINLNQPTLDRLDQVLGDSPNPNGSAGA